MNLNTNEATHLALNPITTYPAERPREFGNCSFAVGDPIPVVGCGSKAGFAIFYNEDTASAHTGFEQKNTVVLYFVEDQSGQAALFVTLNEHGGAENAIIATTITFAAPSLRQLPNPWLVRDDLGPLRLPPDDCGNGRDCYYWNREMGYGRALFAWVRIHAVSWIVILHTSHNELTKCC
eukprot:TRINITY_DN4428_c0_g1_i4.p1 TRINITY_DN4428_c0_g1~~TRINITY_DN4428_c0_g1_i4.p1  ORF type:complete len:179 (+),score=18.20 TRINITY_DN4428_c0_g1_i4:85-621(+)